MSRVPFSAPAWGPRAFETLNTQLHLGRACVIDLSSCDLASQLTSALRDSILGSESKRYSRRDLGLLNRSRAALVLS